MLTRLPWAFALGALLGCRIERHTPAAAADLVLRHGVIWTGSAARPWAEAVAIRDGRLLYVGDDSGVARFLSPQARVLDLSGRMVLPGFQDSHAHPAAGGRELGECNLYDAKSPQEVEGIIRAYVAAHPDLRWIRGNGWQLPVFPNANPGKALLDRLIPDRPAFFWSADGHSAWVNSRALSLAGITSETPNPPNGVIERDARTGEPSGTLREGAADLVASYLPPPTPSERLGAIRRALSEANRFGLTTITDANVSSEDLAAYDALDRRGELTARVNVALRTDPELPVDSMAAILRGLRARYRGTDHLTVNTVKLFVDGVIESHTAALLKPYVGMGDFRGPLVYEPGDLAARVATFDRDGFQIHFHTIGDRAIRVALDAVAFMRRVNGVHDARPILAHLEVIDSSDIPRFRELGAVASFQAYWAQADEYITQLTLPVLGPERSGHIYPIGSVLASGAVVAGGSDWTVSSLNPLDAIQVGITRRDVQAGAGPGWLPEERADLPRMLAAYTINAAYAIHAEHETGTLEAGKLADLIVLDRNLFDVPPDDLHRVRVLLTLLDGHPVWRDSTFTGIVP
ncbi:MAG TPA: amidohydrolase [Gemmatimonadales bacterium]|nr:amidohydrolase [Gemmatimonadales bacterium]